MSRLQEGFDTIGMVHSKMRSVAKLLMVVGFAFSILLSFVVGDVSAQEVETRLSIKPVNASGNYFDLTMSPGETQQLQVELGSVGEAAVDARTFAADAYTIINGGLGIRLDGEPTSGATRWLDYPAETLTLEPGAPIVRTFDVSVPDDVRPGEYLTGLVIQNAEPTGGNTSGGVALKQVNRRAISVAIDVPGERVPALAIGSAEHLMVAGLSVIRTDVENPGNVRLRPSGAFTLTGPDGTNLYTLPVSMDSVYADTSTQVETSLPELLPAGEYTANLWLEDSEHGVRADSGPLQLSIPVLVAPEKMPEPTAVADPAAAPVVETRTVGAPTWALLVAIPAAVILGALIALGVVLGMRRRSHAAAAPQPAGPIQAKIVSPPVVTGDAPRANVRKLLPPSHGDRE